MESALQLTFSNSLDQLVALSGQPGRIDDIREIIQCLINALIKQDDFKLSPDDLASLYGDLVLSQPSSSTSPEHLAIHQTLLDSISVIDDILEDRAMAREALAKEKDKDPSQKETKEKPKHRIIPERQPLVDFIRQLIVSLVALLVSLPANWRVTDEQHTITRPMCPQLGLWTFAGYWRPSRFCSN